MATALVALQEVSEWSTACTGETVACVNAMTEKRDPYLPSKHWCPLLIPPIPPPKSVFSANCSKHLQGHFLLSELFFS